MEMASKGSNIPKDKWPIYHINLRESRRIRLRKAIESCTRFHKLKVMAVHNPNHFKIYKPIGQTYSKPIIAVKTHYSDQPIARRFLPTQYMNRFCI